MSARYESAPPVLRNYKALNAIEKPKQLTVIPKKTDLVSFPFAHRPPCHSSNQDDQSDLTITSGMFCKSATTPHTCDCRHRQCCCSACGENIQRCGVSKAAHAIEIFRTSNHNNHSNLTITCNNAMFVGPLSVRPRRPFYQLRRSSIRDTAL